MKQYIKNEKRREKTRRLESVLKYRSLRLKEKQIKQISSIAQTFQNLKEKQSESQPKNNVAMQMTKHKAWQRNTKVKFPFFDRSVEKKKDLSLTILPRHGSSPNGATFFRNQKIKTISDINPRINRVKFAHLRKSQRQSQSSEKSDDRYLRFKTILQKKLNPKSNIKINISCQKIAPMSKDLEQILKDKNEEANKSTHSNKTICRYKQISTEQFIYENNSSLITQGLMDKISKIRKGSKQYGNGSFFL